MPEPQYVEFLGMKVPIMSDDMISAEADSGEPLTYMVGRVADVNPANGTPELRKRRRKVACENCDEVCWLDPLGYNPTHGKAQILCIQCVADGLTA